MIYVVSFYGYLVPLITPLTIFAFITQYWVDKRNLLRLFSSPVDLGYFLTDLIWKALELTLLLHSLGHIVWSHSLHLHPSEMSQFCNYACLVVPLIYTLWILFIPRHMQILTEKFDAGGNETYTGTYQEQYEKFSKTYKSSNPATSFVDKKISLQEDLIARYTNYSILEAQRIQYKKKFVPENERVLEAIWQNTEDETTIEKFNQTTKDDFTTIFCW